MKMPTSFLPKKCKDIKIEDLKKPQKKKAKSVEDLILNRDAGAPEFVFRKLGVSDLRGSYHLLNTSDIVDGVCVDYDNLSVHILEFKDPDTLVYNLNNIADIVNLFNKSVSFMQNNALFKESYAIFIYTQLGNCYQRMGFIKAYKNWFGFKEVKED